LNDLDRELTNEVLNELAVEDTFNEEFGQLSINALSSADQTNCIRLKTKVQDKVMLILVDSGSSHSFISSHFVNIVGLPTVPIPARKVKQQMVNGLSPIERYNSYSGTVRDTLSVMTW